MRIVLVGAGGMLGTALAAVLPGMVDAAEIVTLGRADLPVANPRRLIDAVAGAAPDMLINAAAHTDVEGAEGDPASAFAANAELPGLLAAACRKAGAPIVHVSSTGCYGDWKETPYEDYDPLRPTTIHHRSKAAGEAAVRDSGAEHLIVRTGWLFGGEPRQPKNFVFKRVQEAAKTDLMRSDPTQRGNPTYVDDLARAMVGAFLGCARGTCNIVSRGSATRLDYVSEIVRLSGLPCRVEASERGFPRRAKVSPNEAAINVRLGLLGLNNMDPWRTQLARYMDALRVTPDWRDVVGRSAEPHPSCVPSEQKPSG